MRRRVIRNLAWIGLALTLVTGGALPGWAQQTNTTDDAVFTIDRVGTIDLVEVLRQSTATSSVRALLDEKRAQFQEEFAAREVDLMAREKALQSKRDVMSAEAFGEEVRLFQAEVADVQREIQRKRKSLDNAFQQAQDKLRDLALEIVGDCRGPCPPV